MYWLLLYCFIVSVVSESSEEHYIERHLESEMPEVVVQDLAGRRRLINRDEDTDELCVHWVLQDKETGLPYVEDPGTGEPYVLQYSAVHDKPRLFRLLRGRDHGPVVVNQDKMELYRPALNEYGEVMLRPATQKEVGFTVKEIMDL